MSTANSVKTQLKRLLSQANAITGKSDTNLTASQLSLIDGYGSGGSGGDGSSIGFLHLLFEHPLSEDQTSFKVYSDVELSDSLSLSDFSHSDNIASVSYIERNMFQVELSHPLAALEEVWLQATSTAYLYKNGTSIKTTFQAVPWENFPLTELLELPATYEHPIRRMTLADLIPMLNNSKTDSGSYTHKDSVGWRKSTSLLTSNPSAKTTSFGITCDSQITVGELVINVNQCDAAGYFIGKQYGICDHGYFVKFRWRGYSFYSYGAIDQDYEIFFLENGDAFLHSIKKGAYAGSYTFKGVAYQIDPNNPYVSFYRQNYHGSQWLIVNEMYDVNKHSKSADVLYQEVNLSEVYNDYETCAMFSNSASDDGTISWTLIDGWAWPHGGSLKSTVYFSGNSWMGIGSVSENVRFNRRDAKIQYAYVRYAVLKDQNDLKATQLVWHGCSQYSGAVDQRWCLWLFENGDAMIHVDQLGTSTGGTTSFFGVSYPSEAGTVVSFYRQDANGSSWKTKQALYDVTKHVI